MDRREFLIRFASASTATLILGSSATGCHGRNKPVKRCLYGPPPVTGPTIVSVKYAAANGEYHPLGTGRVAADAAILITFSEPIDPSSGTSPDDAAQPAIRMVSDARVEVPVTINWESPTELRVVAASELPEPGTYRLLVAPVFRALSDGDPLDSEGTYHFVVKEPDNPAPVDATASPPVPQAPEK